MTARKTPLGIPLEDRLRLLSVEDGNGCWIWQGRISRDGYGRMSMGTARSQAHRVAYELWVGPIPQGMTVDHLCFVTACINPTHLRILSNLDNARNQRRIISDVCLRGHAKSEHWRGYGTKGRMRCVLCARIREAKRAAA